MIRSYLAIGFILGVAPLVAANPILKPKSVTPEQNAKAKSLALKLGSENYREREQASRELQEMGRFALPALAEVLESTNDPEVRFRCELLLPRAEAAEMAARVKAFLADVGGSGDHDLPGWVQFREVCGDNQASRKFFADILKESDNQELLLAMRLSPEELSVVLMDRREQLMERMAPQFPVNGVYKQIMPTLPEAATLLLAEVLVPEEKAPMVGRQFHITNFLYQPDGRKAALGQGEHGEPFRKLLIKWLDTRTTPTGVANAMGIVQNLQFPNPEVARFASKVVEAKDVQPWNKANALGVLARVGADDALPIITKLFDDEAVLIPANPNGQAEILMQDVALAMAINLTNQKHKDYGMQVMGQAQAAKFTPTAYRFADDKEGKAEDKRKAAFKKWKEWESKKAAPNK